MTSELLDQRGQILAALNHLDHVLPGQGPIHEFVHHNTIHGFQHFPFEKALEEYEALTGTYGYLPEIHNRTLYQQGRITDADLSAALAHAQDLRAEDDVFHSAKLTIKRKDIYKVALLHDLQSVTRSQLGWQIEELKALESIQEDVSAQSRERMLSQSSDQSHVVGQLWESILDNVFIKWKEPD